MAKNRHQEPEPTSNRMTMAVMVLGGVLVGGLVVWALTRTVEPAESVMATGTEVSSTASATSASSTTQPVPPAPTATSTGMTFDPGTTSSLPPSVATGQPAVPPPVTGDRSTVQRIAVEDLRAKLNRSEVTVLDVRDARAFAMGHIPGSVNVPFASVETMLDTIPKDKPIVTYCT